MAEKSFNTLGWTPPGAAAVEQTKAQQEEAGTIPDRYIVENLDGKNYEVHDADTLWELDENNVRIPDAKPLRIRGVQAKEVSFGYDRFDAFGEDSALSQGETHEVGSEGATAVTYQYLQDNKLNLKRTDFGEQAYGRGQGNRVESTFFNTETGNEIATEFAAEGIMSINNQTRAKDVEAWELGELYRSLQGEDPTSSYTKLRDIAIEGVSVNPFSQDIFKSYADTEKTFDPLFNTGVKKTNPDAQLWDPTTNRGGLAKAPVTQALENGWGNLQNDLWGFVDILGEGFGSEYLKTEARKNQALIGQELSDAPILAVQNFSDIKPKNNQDLSTTIGNAWEWLGVNAAMSLPYMGAIAASAIAAPIAGGLASAAGAGSVGAVAASLAVGTGLPASFYSGEVWNNLNPEQQTRENIGKTLLAGTVSASLDKLGLLGVISPTKLFTKEGAKLAAAHFGISQAAASKLIGSTAKDVVATQLKDISSTAIKNVNLLKGLRNIGISAGIEGATESAQELVSLLTAAGINEQELPEDRKELFANVKAAITSATINNTPLTAEMIRDVALNAGIAGAVLGGGFSVVGESLGGIRTYQQQKKRDQAGNLEIYGDAHQQAAQRGRDKLRKKLTDELQEVRDSNLSEAQKAKKIDALNLKLAYSANSNIDLLEQKADRLDQERSASHEAATVIQAATQVTSLTTKLKNKNLGASTRKRLLAERRAANKIVSDAGYRVDELNTTSYQEVTNKLLAAKTPIGSVEDLAKAKAESRANLFQREDGTLRVPSFGETITATTSAVSSFFRPALKDSGADGVWTADDTENNAGVREIQQRFLQGLGSGNTNIEQYEGQLFNEASAVVDLPRAFRELGLDKKKSLGLKLTTNQQVDTFDSLANAVFDSGLFDGFWKAQSSKSNPDFEVYKTKLVGHPDLAKRAAGDKVTLQEFFDIRGIDLNIPQWKEINNRLQNGSDLLWARNAATQARDKGATSRSAESLADNKKLQFGYFVKSLAFDRKNIIDNKNEFISAYDQAVAHAITQTNKSITKLTAEARKLNKKTGKDSNPKKLVEVSDKLAALHRDLEDLHQSKGDAAYHGFSSGKADAMSTYSPLSGPTFGLPNKRRLLNLSEFKYKDAKGNDKLFRDTFMKTGIASSVMENITSQSREQALIDYIGDGGKDLDYLVQKAYDIDIANKVPPELALEKAKKRAKNLKDTVDVITGVYKRDEIPDWLYKTQNTILSYTTFVGLPLAAFASAPELGVGVIGAVNDAEVRHLIEQYSEIMKDPLARGAAETETAFEGKQPYTPIINSILMDEMRWAGIPVDEAQVFDRFGAEHSKSFNDKLRAGQEVFFSAIGLNLLTRIQRAVNTSQGMESFRTSLEGLIEVDPNSTPELPRYRAKDFTKLSNLETDFYARLRDNQVHVDSTLYAYIQLRNANEVALTLALDPTTQADAAAVVEKGASLSALGDITKLEGAKDVFKSSLRDYTQNFTNFRVQNPGATNRALIWQDPRFALITQFHGFVSTATTTITNYVFKQKAGGALKQVQARQAPTEAYPFVQTVVVLTALGLLGGWLKDNAKNIGPGEESESFAPWDYPYEEKGESNFIPLLRRAAFNSGLFGLFEKPFNWVFPDTFSEREGFSGRVGGDLLGPASIHLNNFSSLTDSLSKGESARAWNAGLKFIPFLGTSTWFRHTVSNDLGDNSLQTPRR